MEPLLLAVGLAIVCEVVIEALKPALNPLEARLPGSDRVDYFLYLSLLIGVGLAFFYAADALAAVGFGEASAVGTLFTGLVVGRGSNFVHDVIKRLRV